jgi:hypothetical protein
LGWNLLKELNIQPLFDIDLLRRKILKDLVFEGRESCEEARKASGYYSGSTET